MDKTKALQKFLNGTATKKEVELLKLALASGTISIGGNGSQVNTIDQIKYCLQFILVV